MEVTIVLLLFIHSSLGEYTKSYSNYTLFRTLPLTEEHLEFVKNLSTYMRVDYWRPPGLLNKPVEFLINPDDKKMFMRSMDEKQFYYTTIIDDVQKAFDLQTIKPYIRRKMDTFDWRSYFNLKDIYSWIKDLEKTYPNEVTILHLGRTYEDREILGVKVIMRGSKRRSAVVIEGGIHAREWIAPAFATYFLDQLVKSVNKTGSDLEKIAKTYEFYFIPVLNPDGYEFSINTDRMWRKNRNGGYGVDINRNFDAGFGSTGVSSIKLEEIYCGPYAFSEKESQAVQKMTRSIRDKLEYYLAFHSYGQYMIIPYAHLKEHTANYDEMYKILKEAKSKISRRYNTKYTIGTAFETVAFGELEVVLSGGFEEESYVQSTNSTRNVDYLRATHEEADTRMILHAVNSTTNNVVVMSRDTDVVILLAHHFDKMKCSHLWVMSGIARDIKYIPVHDICKKLSPEQVRYLLAFHAITGCDSTSKLASITKIGAWKIFCGENCKLLSGLGCCPLSEDVLKNVETFVVKLYKYVVTLELRDTGTNGFALPTDEILPTCRETLDGIISILKPSNATFRKLKEVGYNRKGRNVMDDFVFIFNVLLFIIVRFY